MKLWVRQLSVVVAACCLTCVCATLYSCWLDWRIERFDFQTQNMLHHGWAPRDLGKVMAKGCIANGDLLILGSSELSSGVPQNVKVFFPNQAMKRKVTPIGGAYSQSLIDGLRIASWKEHCGLTNPVIVVSLQWFYGKDISLNGTAAKFSELQFYDFMFSDRPTLEQKTYIAQRLKVLLDNQSSLKFPWRYAVIYSRSKTLAKLVYPYYLLRYKFLELRDKHDAYKALKRNSKVKISNKLIDWTEEEKKADEMGKKECTNNDFYVYDSYFTKYLKPRFTQRKNASKGTELLVSKEHGDFEFMLEMCKLYNVKPYIILMSTNGWDYDYTGISRDERVALYDKLSNKIRKYGFDYLDLRDKEYDPYFYCDIMHLGWKGWLYCDKKIAEHFK